MRKWMKLLGATALVAVVAAGCTQGAQSNPSAAKQAEDKANSHQVYIPKHDLEFQNYNKRMLISDNPSTILWCTTAFPIPASPLLTVPIVGKLTSSYKRPYATEKDAYPDSNGGGGYYNPEVPGPDGMYGASDPYRFGFDPAGNYQEFGNMPTYCTTEPTTWQREQTTIVMQQDPTLVAAERAAQQQLASGNASGARQTLQSAISQVQGGK